MKNSLKIIAASIFVVVNFTGCNILPYEETFICNKGLNSGSCQSVSENYRDTFVDKNNINPNHLRSYIELNNGILKSLKLGTEEENKELIPVL